MSEHFEREGSQFWGPLDTGAQSACIGTNRWKVFNPGLAAAFVVAWTTAYSSGWYPKRSQGHWRK
eukprot:1183145-Amphidinium_carterae.1